MFEHTQANLCSTGPEGQVGHAVQFKPGAKHTEQRRLLEVELGAIRLDCCIFQRCTEAQPPVFGAKLEKMAANALTVTWREGMGQFGHRTFLFSHLEGVGALFWSALANHDYNQEYCNAA